MRFGTDGVRGVANSELTPEFALTLGRAAASVLGSSRFVIGRDPRHSGPLLEAALAAGICAAGADVELLGVVPTPAVAYLSGADSVAGAMISASHNPAADNGIKLFAPGGLKLSDADQAAIEAKIDELTGAGPDPHAPTGAAVGFIRHVEGRAAERYEEHVAAALEGRSLDGLRVVLDCANGAASAVAPALFRAAGAQVTVLHDTPDGLNINDRCGSTHPADLQAAVVAEQADLGLAFDGDADRLIAVDHTGELVDGDELIAMSAIDLDARGRLVDRTVVVTVMTNLGFHHAMERAGIAVVQTAVGDRYLLEALDARALSLGGEQSGHLIFRDVATTGDGVLSGLFVADLVVRSGTPLRSLAGVMERLPQVLVNVRLAARPDGLIDELAGDVAAVEAEFAGSGRVLLRASGTEPLIRVMVEAPTKDQAANAAQRLAERVEAVAAALTRA